MKIAEDAIDLFLEYRDKHGHDEEAAKYCALNEFAEAESEEVRTSSEKASPADAIAWLNGALVDDEGRLILTRDYIVRCLAALTPSATTRISAIPLIKRLKQQRDEIADVLRQAFDARGCRVVNHDGSCVVTSEWVEAATVALRDVPTYEQQIRNIAEGIGMSYDDLIAAVSASMSASDSGNPR